MTELEQLNNRVETLERLVLRLLHTLTIDPNTGLDYTALQDEFVIPPPACPWCEEHRANPANQLCECDQCKQLRECR